MSLRHRAQSICALMFLSSCLFGQTVSSSLVGTVLDPSSAVVPNAAVTATDQETGAVRAVTTDSSGTFRFLNLTPGEYSLSITGHRVLRGYGEGNYSGGAGNPRRRQTRLAIGTTTDTIAITAEVSSHPVGEFRKGADHRWQAS